MFNEINTLSHLLGHGLLTGQILGNELVQRRVEQTDIDGHAVHALQNAIEILLLKREQFSQSYLPFFPCVGENHLTHGLDFVLIEEHVLRTAQANTHCTKLVCDLSVVRCVSIGAHNHTCILVAKAHKLGKIA